jgi:hypothetical protein
MSRCQNPSGGCAVAGKCLYACREVTYEMQRAADLLGYDYSDPDSWDMAVVMKVSKMTTAQRETFMTGRY